MVGSRRYFAVESSGAICGDLHMWWSDGLLSWRVVLVSECRCGGSTSYAVVGAFLALNSYRRLVTVHDLFLW